MAITPVRIDTTEDPFAGTGRAPLFYVDDQAYTIPIDVPAGFALEAIEKMAEIGDVLGTRWLMMEILGAEGYAALLAVGRKISKTEMGQINKAIRELVFGDEEEEGKG